MPPTLAPPNKIRIVGDLQLKPIGEALDARFLRAFLQAERAPRPSWRVEIRRTDKITLPTPILITAEGRNRIAAAGRCRHLQASPFTIDRVDLPWRDRDRLAGFVQCAEILLPIGQGDLQRHSWLDIDQFQRDLAIRHQDDMAEGRRCLADLKLVFVGAAAIGDGAGRWADGWLGRGAAGQDDRETEQGCGFPGAVITLHRVPPTVRN